MEFKEFENPEQADYDLKVGNKSAKTTNVPVDNSLNTDEGVDLNALVDEMMTDFENPKPNVSTSGATINEFGEIIRPNNQGKPR